MIFSSNLVILLLAHYTQVAQILVQARQLKMLDGVKDQRYVFLTTGFKIEKEEWRKSEWLEESKLIKDDVAKVGPR